MISRRIRNAWWACGASLVASIAGCVPGEFTYDGGVIVMVAPWLRTLGGAVAACTAAWALVCGLLPGHSGAAARALALVAALGVYPVTQLAAAAYGMGDWRPCGDALEVRGLTYRMLAYSAWQDRDVALVRQLGRGAFADTFQVLATHFGEPSGAVPDPIRPEGPTGSCGRIHATPSGVLLGVQDIDPATGSVRAVGYDLDAARPYAGSVAFLLIGAESRMNPRDVAVLVDRAGRAALTADDRAALQDASTHPNAEVRALAARLLAPRR